MLLTLKLAGGGIHPSSTDMACIPSIFFQTSQFFFGESCLMSAFTKNFFKKLRGSSIFQSSHPSQKNMLPKANDQKKKKTICQIFHQKKIHKVLMKIEEMATQQLCFEPKSIDQGVNS
jgi:hypothetical protein